MSVVGIIAEYDPFHWGHLYQLEKARELTGAESVIVVLGGDFLQRGTPSMIEKRLRARIALDAGVDLVLALPYIYSVNSAREYAAGAVGILSGTGCVDYISFGCEDDNVSLLNKAASVMIREEELSPIIKEKLRSGLSWPEAATQALELLGGKDLSELLRRPNNLLACEYIRAISEQGASLKPVPVRRITSYYDDQDNDTEAAMNYLSASQIRSLMRKQGISAIQSYVPEETMNSLNSECQEKRFSDRMKEMDQRMLALLRYRMITSDSSELKSIYSVEEGLENRFTAAAADSGIQSVSELVRTVSTRRYTRARIMRMLTHILLNFKKDDFEWLRGASCTRVLACTEKGRKILARMRKTAEIPVLSNLAGLDRYDARTRKIIEIDLRAAGLYEILQGGSDLTGGEIRYVPYMK